MPQPPHPSTFLPRLPKCTYTLSPLSPSTLLSSIDRLQSLLVTPVHGTVASPFSQVKQLDDDPSGSVPVVLEDDAHEEAVLDEFERQWAEQWLNGIVRRGEGWLAEVEETSDDEEEGDDLVRQAVDVEVKAREDVLDRASALIALLAGCSAAGNLVRTVSFPLHPLLCGLDGSIPPLNTGPTLLQPKPINPRHVLPPTPELTRCSTPTLSTSSSVATSRSSSMPGTPANELVEPSSLLQAKSMLIAAEELEIKLHDAVLSDHLSVGVQTWGSSILMSRIVARDFESFFGGLDEEVDESENEEQGPNVLELGAGTGLLSILSRKMLDKISMARERKANDSGKRQRRRSTDGSSAAGRYGRVVATDFHPSVLDNLKTCVELNFPGNNESIAVDILPLDWSTFPSQAARSPALTGNAVVGDDDKVNPALRKPFDVIFVADCVYDTTHAGMIKDCIEWTLRPPRLRQDGTMEDEGGVVHLLSPLRPTYAAETASIAAAFPPTASVSALSSHPASPSTSDKSPACQRGFRLVTKRQRTLERMKGNGRADEVEYTWWEIGWA